MTAKVDYERFLHELDHDPLSNMAPTSASQASPATTNPKIIEQDLGVGQDYAVRVQELKASIKGIVCEDNLKVRVDVWGQEKEGTRQVNAVAMCYTQTATLPPDHPPVNTFTGGRCHVLSQPQQIDWMTTEVKPVIEARLTDGLTLEYSRPMRTFTADDSTTTRFYNGVGKLTYNATTNPDPYAYAVVPDSYTQMDQLKLSGRITDDNRVYAYLMIGNTVNEEIDMNRWFNDMDVRWTNTSIENVSLTTYGTIYNEDEQNPNIFALGMLSPETAPSTLAQAVREPLDYHKSTAGLRGTWRPWGGGYDQGGLAIVGGYEYCDLQRQDAIYTLATSTLPPVPAGSVLDQSHTITNSFQIGPTYRWSSSFDTYLRYKYQDAQQPLVGLNASNTLGVNTGIFDTLLPQHDHIVELGFNWFPSEWFMFNACIGVERGDNHSQYANFDEENYPMSFNAWYAASAQVVVVGRLRRLLGLRGAEHHGGRPTPLHRPGDGCPADYLAVELRRAGTRRDRRLTLRLDRAGVTDGQRGMGAGPRPDLQLGDHGGAAHSRPGHLFRSAQRNHPRHGGRRLEGPSPDGRLRPLRAVQLQRHGPRLPDRTGPGSSGRTLVAVLNGTVSLSLGRGAGGEGARLHRSPSPCPLPRERGLAPLFPHRRKHHLRLRRLQLAAKSADLFQQHPRQLAGVVDVVDVVPLAEELQVGLDAVEFLADRRRAGCRRVWPRGGPCGRRAMAAPISGTPPATPRDTTAAAPPPTARGTSSRPARRPSRAPLRWASPP